MDIALIYMASGRGRRFGSNKLLYALNGRPLYQYGFIQLQEAARLLHRQEDMCCRLWVVSPYEEILDWCRKQGACVQKNSQAAGGMAASVRLGTACAGTAGAYAFFAADQPFIQGQTIVFFLRGFIRSGRSLGCMACGPRKGNPAIFLARYRPKLLALQGDTGGRQILRDHSEEVWYFSAAAEELQDIDTREDLKQALKML